ncbi:MAG: hypothetical protein J0L87_03670 [Bacteroidetes bacterium]|nr:hypothetical protein [Bacteroidota bacterium]
MKILNNILLMIMLVIGNSVLPQTQTEIHKDALPEEVKEHLHKKYKNCSVVNIVKITFHSGIRIYKLEAHKKINRNRSTIENIYYLTYDTKGKLILKIKDRKTYYANSPPSKMQPSTGGYRYRH